MAINPTPYRHLFFDLDRTLWDFESNAARTLQEIVDHFELLQRGIPSAENFITTYRKINNQMWDAYRKGELDKDTLRSERFHRALKSFGIDDEDLGAYIGTYYIRESPLKTKLFDGAHETLEYLQDRYTLHIITNGFEEVQHVKLENSRLRGYFDLVVTSEGAGVKKPDPGIFHHALEQAGAAPKESLMIGDDVKVDLLGAKGVGMDQVYFDPHGVTTEHPVTYRIEALSELRSLL
ncbi:MAG: YjjG family noncanonical pyrimidine nucleotidase [Salibacteraceae bacterium]